MKEKRILAMFITSVVTLVTSLAVTFGVLMTLADPVVATGITRYDYAFNSKVNSLVVSEGKTIKLKDKVVFQPSSKVVWSEEDGERAVWFNGADYNNDIVYADESISTRIKVVPIRIANNFKSTMQARVSVAITANSSSALLARYTNVMIYNYSSKTFVEAESITLDVLADSYADIAVVVFADDSLNTSSNKINWGVDYATIDVIIENSNI